MKFTTLLSPDDIRQGVAFLARNDYLNLLPLSLLKNFTAKMVNRPVLNVYLSGKN